MEMGHVEVEHVLIAIGIVVALMIMGFLIGMYRYYHSNKEEEGDPNQVE